jgi:hypothetical protein|tara:strand:- start:30 stop:614 length:585 start_codon:yes stop_codon:yes gene_type:complete
MAMTSSTKKTTPKVKGSTPIPDLPPNPFVYEVLELASKQRSNSKKVEVLRKFEHDSLKSIFIFNFDQSVISLLPPGEVPYGDAEDQSVYSGSLSENLEKEAKGGESATGQDLDGRGKTSLRREYQNLYHFVKGGNTSLNNIRREMMFINLLRGLHPKEAEVLILIKDKCLDNKYKITLSNVKEAYPDVQWGGRS